MQENFIVESVTEGKDSFFIQKDTGMCFGLSKEYGITPKVGDIGYLYTINFSEVRGLRLNGELIFYKTDAQLKAERKKWIDENNRKKLEDFENNKDGLDNDYNSLPNIFKARIDRFRSNNSTFRVDFESYEMFCCVEAMKIVKACNKPEDVDLIKNSSIDIGLDMRNHSGNTFGFACALARAYLTDLSLFMRIPGAMAPLVGSEEYGG